MRYLALLFLIPIGLLVACGGDDDDSSLQPAATVESQRSATAAATAGQAKVLAIGEQATLNDGLKVTVQGVERNPVIMEGTRERSIEAGYKFALVAVRYDNTGSEDASADITIQCDGGKKGARYFYEVAGSFDPAKRTPAKSFAEGKVLMGVPDDCANGRILLKSTGAFTEKDPQKSAMWALP